MKQRRGQHDEHVFCRRPADDISRSPEKKGDSYILSDQIQTLEERTGEQENKKGETDVCLIIIDCRFVDKDDYDSARSQKHRLRTETQPGEDAAK